VGDFEAEAPLGRAPRKERKQNKAGREVANEWEEDPGLDLDVVLLPEQLDEVSDRRIGE
jgi:hypothetical protein